MPRQRLDTNYLRRTAAQYHAVADVLDAAASVSGESHVSSIVHLDDWFFLAFKIFDRGSGGAFDWLDGPLLELQLKEEGLVRSDASFTIFRHFVIPHPHYLQKINRGLYRELITSVLHFQLSTSVLIFCHFVHPNKDLEQNLTRASSTVIFPEQRLGWNVGQFYVGDYDGLQVLSTQGLENTIAAIARALSKVRSQHWLSYVAENFQAQPLRQTYRRHWERLRLFHWDLSGPEHRCFHCMESITSYSDMDLDHLVPSALGGTNILTNLRPAHASCNRRRRADPHYGAQFFHPANGVLKESVVKRFDTTFLPLWVDNEQRASSGSRTFLNARNYSLVSQKRMIANRGSQTKLE